MEASCWLKTIKPIGRHFGFIINYLVVLFFFLLEKNFKFVSLDLTTRTALSFKCNIQVSNPQIIVEGIYLWNRTMVR